MATRQNASTGQMVGNLADGLVTEIDGKPVMRIKIYSPFQSFFDDYAFSISAVNKSGPFDILPHHHNFITLLDACELAIQSKRGEQLIRISAGLMHVKEDKVVVFLDV